MWKGFVILFLSSFFFLSGCASMSSRMVENQSDTTPPKAPLTLESKLVQEALEKLPPTHKPVEVREGTMVSVSRGEFYGNIPCRFYQIISSNAEGQRNYTCAKNGKWIHINREGMIYEFGRPTVMPHEQSQKQIAQATHRSRSDRSRERTQEEDQVDTNEVDTSKKVVAEEGRKEVQKAPKKRPEFNFTTY